MACAVEEGEPVEQKVFIRGDYNSPGEDAPKDFPAILAALRHEPAYRTAAADCNLPNGSRSRTIR